MTRIGKFIALVPLAVVLFLGNAYGSLWFAGLIFPREVPRPYTEMIGAAVVGALVGGVLVAYPLIRMFPSRYWVAALAASSPIVALRANDFLDYVGSNQRAVVTMSLVEMVLVPLGAVLASWAFMRYLPRAHPNAA